MTAKLAGGSAPIGALTKAVTQLIGSAADARDLFHLGAFDLAGRVRNAAAAVDPMPDILSRFLSDSERQALGYTASLTTTTKPRKHGRENQKPPTPRHKAAL